MGNNNNRILVVDDEEKIVEVVKSYLEHEGYEVFTAYNGKEALDMFQKVSPSLVVLDLMLPDITGEDVCKILRKKSRVPIMMVTAKVDEESILQGLAFGADDYITKPFSLKQFAARVGTLLRRTADEMVPLSNEISFYNNDFMINFLKREVKKKGTIVNLTPTEYRILLSLIKHPNKTFTREELICSVFDEKFESYDRTIDTHVKNLRQKVETDPKNPDYILTVHGIGYKFGGDKDEI